MNDLIQNALLGARLLRPYYARAIAALVPVERPGLNTIAVDNMWRLYYDPVWLEALPQEQRAGVIAGHEVEHLLRNHTARGKAINAEPRAWNVCGDAEINDDATDIVLPPGAVMPASLQAPEGLMAEDYYLNLPEGKNECCGGGSGAGREIEGELGDDGGKTPGVAADEAEALRDAVADDIRQHIKANGRGSVPAGVAIWADAHGKPPKIKWPRLLAAYIANTSRQVVAGRHDYSWRRLSRRQRIGTPLRPGTITYRPRIAVVVDTSGSMGGEGDTVVGTMHEIIKRYGDVVTVQCDAEVTSIARGAPKQYKGGGGTDLRGAIAKADGIGDIVVVITDGDTPWPAATKHPTTVIVTSESTNVPSWAHIVRVGGAK